MNRTSPRFRGCASVCGRLLGEMREEERERESARELDRARRKFSKKNKLMKNDAFVGFVTMNRAPITHALDMKHAGLTYWFAPWV